MIKEVIGYIGALLFIVATVFTSIRNYRLLNLVASIVCAVYGIMINSTPMLVLMIGLAVVNFQKVIKPAQKKYYDFIETDIDNPMLKYLLERYKRDIKSFYPQYQIDETINYVKVGFHDGKPVAFVLAIRNEEELKIVVDYTISKYRDSSIGRYLYPLMAQEGIKKVVVEDKTVDNDKYLRDMGFVKKGSSFVKEI